MKIKISYSKEAEKFLLRNQNIISEEQVDNLLTNSVKVILNKEKLNVDLKKIKGTGNNLYRIRKGKIRILFTIFKNDLIILNVEDIGFRGNIY